MVDERAHSELLTWWQNNKRNLPWRETRDPWKIFISELMLQQTQVDRVIPKYEEFILRFPTVESCSEASLAEVLVLWSGLGYNRRARFLYECAKQVVIKHGGNFPHTREELLKLPGIGSYTSQAILVFAFEQNVGVLDTNVARIIARFFGKSFSQKDAQSCVDAWVPISHPWNWNQALMDLGSAICKKQQPMCEWCPLNNSCSWGRNMMYQNNELVDSNNEEKNFLMDPALKTAGISGKQSTFIGSDRQGRGNLLNALRTRYVEGSYETAYIPFEELKDCAGWDDEERAYAVAQTLVDDGLAKWGKNKTLLLPKI